jgi:hypothetical protein
MATLVASINSGYDLITLLLLNNGEIGEIGKMVEIGKNQFLLLPLLTRFSLLSATKGTFINKVF